MIINDYYNGSIHTVVHKPIKTVIVLLLVMTFLEYDTLERTILPLWKKWRATDRFLQLCYKTYHPITVSNTVVRLFPDTAWMRSHKPPIQFTNKRKS